MIEFTCDKGHHTDLVHNVQNGKPICVGFYCPKCQGFYKSIGREKQLPINYGKKRKFANEC